MSKLPAVRLLFAVGLLLVLAACGPGEHEDAWRGEAPKAPADPAADAGYLKPPMLLASQAQAGGGILLTGQSEPGSTVRLGSPTGEAFTVTAGPDGRWTTRLAVAETVRLYGLSMKADNDRQIQAQGYLAILPDGRAAQLRAGAGAFVVGPGSTEPRLLTVDFDRDGAATIGGTARPVSGVSLRIDRTARGAGKTDREGVYHLAVDHPLGPGRHSVEIAGESGEQTLVLPITPAAPLSSAFRAGREAAGWRIDWNTPGGGVQSTLILDLVS